MIDFLRSVWYVYPGVRVVGVTLRVVGYIVKERDEKKTSETLRRVSLYQKSALYGFIVPASTSTKK